MAPGSLVARDELEKVSGYHLGRCSQPLPSVRPFLHHGSFFWSLRGGRRGSWTPLRASKSWAYAYLCKLSFPVLRSESPAFSARKHPPCPAIMAGTAPSCSFAGEEKWHPYDRG